MFRVLLGFEFLWAFLDKTFGLGYATPSARAWINGGSPTKGFLGSGQAVGQATVRAPQPLADLTAHRGPVATSTHHAGGHRALTAAWPLRGLGTRIAREVDARPGVRPDRVALDDVSGEPTLAERSGGAETSDPGADHENSQTGAVTPTYGVSHRMSAAAWSRASMLSTAGVRGSMFWFARNRLSGS